MALKLTKRGISIALGTEKVRGVECINYIQQGLVAGYRMIDSAQAYQNEEEIGQAVRNSLIPRENIFVINKISSGFKKNPRSVKEASDSARASIDRLGLSYVDLFLIHQPGDSADDTAADSRRVTWQALEDLVEEGSIKSIGVCNYTAEHILELRQFAKIYPPRVNQLELHPWCQQRKLESFCRDQGIGIQAYSAIARNSHSSHPELCALATKYNKSTAQVLIRYSLQKAWTPIVKSTSLAHLHANLQVENFTISRDDMKMLDSWDKKMEGSIRMCLERIQMPKINSPPVPWLINTAEE
ncbi:putative aldo-keto reductase [Mytilinidion resinicola]|uniref:Aldo-keto reductase n=1 Tax=Mytilinidion resinicola TaxID=574789 RepID=A0A6A6YQF1_9PEZI|nr:putative aldo-keto reductase [Mytilinidion resinicola]KAF2810739.1 putative aldo-keto reductase [Mytilinidion resinicola]